MAVQILMPALSPTMEEGTLSKWLVKEGDEVRSGDVIAEIETDKATMEVESIDEGRIGQILIAEGTEGVKVNTPIATIIEDGEEAVLDASPEPAPVESAPAYKPAPIEPIPAYEPAPAEPIPAYEPAPAEPAPMYESEATAPEAEPQTTSTNGGEPVAAPAQAEASANPEPASAAAMVTMTVREALRDAMAEEMRQDEDIFIMGEEVAEYQGAYKITQGLLDEFGSRRVIDTPITEHGFCGVGVGAALAGLKPVVEFMTWNFAMQAIDHIINSAAKTLYMSGGQMHCPIVFRGPNGAAARVAAQHSQCFSAWYAHVPGLKVIAPYTASDAKGLLKAAIRDPNPVVFLENEILYGQSFDVPDDDDWVVPIGKAHIAREGSDVTIVSFARGMTYALEAAEALAGEGIDAEVIDLRTLRPLDMDTIVESVRKTNRIVTVEEAWPTCSIGSEIAARLAAEAFDYLDAPPTKVSGADIPMPYAANLEKLALPTAAQVSAAAKSVCYVN